MDKQNFERGAGILCHISSLPNEYGIGSLGKEAYDFARVLASCHVKYWQILPLVQTSYGDSPYQSASCLSGNPYFIDLEKLHKEGLLSDSELDDAKVPFGDIDYGELYVKRYETLRLAFSRFDKTDPSFLSFVESGRFEDYALFMALKEKLGVSLKDFPEEYKKRDEGSLARFKEQNMDEYLFWVFLQYKFFEQWAKLKAFVNGLGIKIIGDIPLYVAYDSADVWKNPSLFELDKDLNPVEVAGVPPDYFSEDGQLWGNPIYDWDEMKKTDFAWWTKRLGAAKEMYDIVRIDHFRGLDRYYAVKFGEKTAREGEWKTAYGFEMLKTCEERLGGLFVFAEDLGIIDDGVLKLLDETGYARMKVTMFAFDGNSDNEYLPKHTDENSVCYTGTHDNDTALGFVENMSEEVYKNFVRQLRRCVKEQGLHECVVNREDCVKALCLITLSTRSQIAVLPIQDWLILDNSSRMNIPSTRSGNWVFRTKMPTLTQRGLLRKYIRKTDR